LQYLTQRVGLFQIRHSRFLRSNRLPPRSAGLRACRNQDGRDGTLPINYVQPTAELWGTGSSIERVHIDLSTPPNGWVYCITLGRRGGLPINMNDVYYPCAPWHFLYFLPEPQGQGAFGLTFGTSRRTVAARVPACEAAAIGFDSPLPVGPAGGGVAAAAPA
jgi:hypothetical protein